MSQKKILVVDDSALLHTMYDLVFLRQKSHGVEILHAYNGRQALTCLEKTPGIGVVLLDINMPVMSGLEFLEERRRSGKNLDVPVIIVSARGREEDTARGMKAGATAYLTKPLQPTELHPLVDRMLGPPAAASGPAAHEPSAGGAMPRPDAHPKPTLPSLRIVVPPAPVSVG